MALFLKLKDYYKVFKKVFLLSLISINLYACNYENAAAMREHYFILLERARRQDCRQQQEKFVRDFWLHVAPNQDLIDLAKVEGVISLKIEQDLRKSVGELVGKLLKN